MDSKQLGEFISSRRKELKLTQAALAAKIHVTDKAVSRWERGVGMPDINNLESLAEALDISLIELIQARKNETDSIAIDEAEMIIVDTIHLSQENNTNKIKTIMGMISIGIIVFIDVLMLLLILKDGPIVFCTATGIIAGLTAWIIPIWHLLIKSSKETKNYFVISLAFAVVSIILMMSEIANEVYAGDMAAVIDITDHILIAVVGYTVITFLLNIKMLMLNENTGKQ